MGGDQPRPPRPRRRPHRFRQDPQRLPVEPRPAGHPRAAAQGRAVPRPLRLAAQGPRGRRRAQPPRPPGRHPPHRRAARREPPRRHGRPALRRHLRGRPSPAVDGTARRADHDARVAVPDAHQPGPRDAAQRRDRDRRRGPRRRRHQARRPPRAQPRAPRPPAPPPRPAHRVVRHGPTHRGGRPVPRRAGTRRDRLATEREAVGPPGGGPRRGHDRLPRTTTTGPRATPTTARAGASRSGPTSRNRSPTWSRRTAPPSSSPTVAGWPSG